MIPFSFIIQSNSNEYDKNMLETQSYIICFNLCWFVEIYSNNSYILLRYQSNSINILNLFSVRKTIGFIIKKNKCAMEKLNKRESLQKFVCEMRWIRIIIVRFRNALIGSPCVHEGATMVLKCDKKWRRIFFIENQIAAT